MVGEHGIRAIETADPAAAEAFSREALSAGHEGVLVKALDSPYAAGRRGRQWLKVKPVHTYDLVVLAAEWGSGRRTGWLSNLHLGARDEGLGATVAGTVPVGAAAGVAALVAAVGAVELRWLSPTDVVPWPVVGWYAAPLTVVAAVGAAWLVAVRCRTRLGGVTGDVLGAAVEVSLAAGLIVAATLR